MGGVRFFGGHCAWVARWTGAGLTPVKFGVWIAFVGDLSARTPSAVLYLLLTLPEQGLLNSSARWPKDTKHQKVPRTLLHVSYKKHRVST